MARTTAAISTLSSGTKSVPYMLMTIAAIDCPAPVLPSDFSNCLIPGGDDMWSRDGFYSPGQCFVGYRAMCTQTAVVSEGWPVRKDETAVRCIPEGYECNDERSDQKYATTIFDGTVLSAPAFEIRWRSEDLSSGLKHPGSGVETLPPPLTNPPIVTDPSKTGQEADATTTVQTFESDPPPSHSKLSPGSIAGVIVGGGMGGLALILMGVYLAIRRRRRHAGETRLPGALDDPNSSSQGQPAELDNKPMQPKELSGVSVAIPMNQGLSKDSERRQSGFYPNIAHISLNEVPIEMAAEPVSRPQKSQAVLQQGERQEPR